MTVNYSFKLLPLSIIFCIFGCNYMYRNYASLCVRLYPVKLRPAAVGMVYCRNIQGNILYCQLYLCCRFRPVKHEQAIRPYFPDAGKYGLMDARDVI